MACNAGQAESADVILFFAGVTMLNQRDCQTSEEAPGWVPFLEGEGQDRHDINLPATQIDMLKVCTPQYCQIRRWRQKLSLCEYHHMTIRVTMVMVVFRSCA